MTRIIAGAASAARLKVPAAGTRPTSDKVREALFSALEASFEFADARVLDLYAGSGALGLEAVSRGAESAVLVEQARSAAQLLKQNCEAVQALVPGARIEVAAEPVRRFLGAAGAEFDLAFVDPPYNLDNAALSGDLELLLPRLSPDALVIVERDMRSGAFELPAGLQLWRERKYGETVLFFIEPRA